MSVFSPSTPVSSPSSLLPAVSYSSKASVDAPVSGSRNGFSLIYRFDGPDPADTRSGSLPDPPIGRNRTVGRVRELFDRTQPVNGPTTTPTLSPHISRLGAFSNLVGLGVVGVEAVVARIVVGVLGDFNRYPFCKGFEVGIGDLGGVGSVVTEFCCRLKSSC